MITLEEPISPPATPLYRQVELFLRAEMESGHLRAGDMLPSVRDLCAQFGGINHLTVRQAIKNLAEENLVRSVQGRGTYVMSKPVLTRRIAILLPHLEDTLFVSIARGAQEYLQNEGIHTIILDSRGSEGVEADHIGNLRNLPLDGALIFPIADSNVAEQIMKLRMDEFSFVLLDRYFEDIAAPCVVVDNFQGGYQSGKHLASQGRRRVGWVGELRSTAARQRLEGLRSALNDADIACPFALIQPLDIRSGEAGTYHDRARDGVRDAVDRLLRTQPLLDGLVCCDDACALSALEKLVEAGKRVPEDVALIGFDDVPAAALSTPSLTTIRQPMQELGRSAATMLLRRMRDKTLPVMRETLAVELVIRQSA